MTELMEVFNTVGMWAVFAFLFVQERKAHENTRKLWVDDLRDVAGLKQHLAASPPTPSTKNDLEVV